MLSLSMFMYTSNFLNYCACAARVTVLGLSVCVSVKSHLTSGASVRPEILLSTQQATEVKIFVGFSLKQLRCWDQALPPLKAICTIGHFSCEKRACALSRTVNIETQCRVAPRVLNFSAFIYLLDSFFTHYHMLTISIKHLAYRP